MPIFLEPGQRYPICLEADKGKTPRPTFYAKSQSMRGQLQIANVLDRLTSDQNATAADLFNDAVECLANTLVGWSGMLDPETNEEIPFSRDALFQVLTYGEARELMRKVAYNQHLDDDEKKESESQR